MKLLIYIAITLISLSSFAQQKMDTTTLVADAKQAYLKIEGYRQRVLKGESMATIATLYTEDPGSAKTGGRYDNISRGMFVPEFEAAAFALKPGEISEVFETTYGFHFVQLVARSGDIISVRHILVTTKTNGK